MKTQRPKQIRIGRIKATIWENGNENSRRRPTVVFSKLYKVDNDWKETNAFTCKDLLLLSKVINDVHSSLHQSYHN